MRIVLCSDAREQRAYAVAEASIQRYASQPVWIHRLELTALQRRGLYHRPTEKRAGRLFDVHSGAHMATEHSIARFFVPELCSDQWVVSMDCDVLVRDDIAELFALADPSKAVQVVKHQQESGAIEKMDGQVQQFYARKNWSSVILWNLAHPAHMRLTLSMLNSLPGRDLHAFKWLNDDEIGELPVEWNYLVGVSKLPTVEVTAAGGPREHVRSTSAKLAHFTLGTPDMPGYAACEFADEWRAFARQVQPDAA